MNYLIYFIFFITVPCGFFSSKIAGNKGWDRFNWFLAGFFFNIIGLFSASALHDRKQREYLRLIAESQGINDDKIQINSNLKSQCLGKFILPKSSSRLDIIEKIIEIMGTDFAPNIDRNKVVIRKQPYSPYRQLLLRNLKGSLILIAHGKEVSQSEYEWFLENPPSIPLPDILLIFRSRLTQFRRSGDY